MPGSNSHDIHRHRSAMRKKHLANGKFELIFVSFFPPFLREFMAIYNEGLVLLFSKCFTKVIRNFYCLSKNRGGWSAGRLALIFACLKILLKIICKGNKQTMAQQQQQHTSKITTNIEQCNLVFNNTKKICLQIFLGKM